MATFPSQVRDNPMTLPKLEILESQGCHFSPPEATADEKREQSTIALTAKSLDVSSTDGINYNWNGTYSFSRDHK
jgi:hypothetical protein